MSTTWLHERENVMRKERCVVSAYIWLVQPGHAHLTQLRTATISNHFFDALSQLIGQEPACKVGSWLHMR